MDPDQGVLRTEICFPDGAPPRLASIEPEALDDLRWAAFDDGRPLRRRGGRLLLDRRAPGTCVQYAVDLGLAVHTSRFNARFGRDLLTSTGAWLWRPDPLPDAVDATVRFELPDGMHVLTAWPVDPAAGAYRLDATAFAWRAAVAFGRFRAQAMDVAGGRLVYARLGQATDPPDAAVRRWLAAAARAVATIEGHLPVPRVTLAIAPAPPGPDPVSFGMVQRGGGPSIYLLLRRHADPDALVRDWVAVHELSHLLLPHTVRRDAWLSEGLATYHQEVARARAGLITEAQAWREIDDGFERGRRGGTQRDLEQESEEMYETYAFRRVYWAGAAYALEADVRLRTEHDTSLDALLARLGREPGVRSRIWSAADVLRTMGRFAHADLLVRMAAAYLGESRFPDMTDLFARLGLIHDEDGRLLLDADAPLASVRDAIMRGAPQGPADAKSSAADLSASGR